ncbi:MAG: clostripain, partial [Spirochaetes bacterium]|nr:clostripain [Spirochaetota bacterium]
KQLNWTFMIYADGDNNLENLLLMDVEEMKDGFINGQGYNLIVLADRIDGYSVSKSGFGSDFTDTRLYRISQETATRISGQTQFPEITTSSNYEANMGDAGTLKKFVRFCKANYPANHYALIFWNHGLGVAKKGTGDSDAIPNKGICVDMTSNNDFLYTAEITDVLSSEDSVDLLGYDACLMGSIETAYQYRSGTTDFHADIMAASAPAVWGLGWKYDEILQRIQTGGGDNGETNDVTGSGHEAYYASATMSAADLCNIIVEEQYDSVGVEMTDQSLSCYDLSKAATVKTAVDTLAVSLAGYKDELEGIRGSYDYVYTMHYFNPSNIREWLQYPFFDLYDLARRTNLDTISFTPVINNNAASVMTAVDEMILCSFGGTDYYGFTKGKNGMLIFFPDGDRLYEDDRFWSLQWWYNAIDTTKDGLFPNQLYGKIAFCRNGAVSGNSTVENWFELLDSWFDINNLPDDDLNNYQY